MVLFRRDEGNGRKYARAARARLIAVSLFFIPVAGVSQQINTPHNQSSQAKTSPQAPVPPIAGVQYRPNCEGPANPQDANYCVEKRAAEAADKQAEWAQNQLAASVVGIFAVLATLIYTAKSVSASQRSAKAAEDAVTTMKEIDKRQGGDIRASIAEVARSAAAMEALVSRTDETNRIAKESMVSSFRPWLEVGIEVRRLWVLGEETISADVYFLITNRGKFPALKVHPYAWIVEMEKIPVYQQDITVRFVPNIWTSRLGITIFPSDTATRRQIQISHPLTPINKRLIDNPGFQPTVFIAGSIVYGMHGDPTGHETGFVFSINIRTATPGKPLVAGDSFEEGDLFVEPSASFEARIT